MTTTELIELLKSVEHGGSGKPREIYFWDSDSDKHYTEISINMTGEGCAGAELGLLISE